MASSRTMWSQKTSADTVNIHTVSWQADKMLVNIMWLNATMVQASSATLGPTDFYTRTRLWMIFCQRNELSASVGKEWLRLCPLEACRLTTSLYCFVLNQCDVRYKNKNVDWSHLFRLQCVVSISLLRFLTTVAMSSPSHGKQMMVSWMKLLALTLPIRKHFSELKAVIY